MTDNHNERKAERAEWVREINEWYKMLCEREILLIKPESLSAERENEG